MEGRTRTLERKSPSELPRANSRAEQTEQNRCQGVFTRQSRHGSTDSGVVWPLHVYRGASIYHRIRGVSVNNTEKWLIQCMNGDHKAPKQEWIQRHISLEVTESGEFQCDPLNTVLWMYS